MSKKQINIDKSKPRKKRKKFYYVSEEHRIFIDKVQALTNTNNENTLAIIIDYAIKHKNNLLSAKKLEG